MNTYYVLAQHREKSIRSGYWGPLPSRHPQGKPKEGEAVGSQTPPKLLDHPTLLSSHSLSPAWCPMLGWVRLGRVVSETCYALQELGLMGS